ncbi:hypothetical protein ABGN05_25310 [Aquibium sp. LZ166]|uniref:DUF4282 domain-containing protein n=1 Tax=Aquibium pacificus TaxID=3153579 RepID=A0ABV3SQ92_9HYPH
MWDFDIGRTLGILARTWPFILLRLVVYFGITMGYILATGAGAGVGYGVGHIVADPDGPLTFAFWGGILGFGAISLLLYWLREYILYMIKAGHIAAMVLLIDGRDLPEGQGQIAYARNIVTERFAEANALFVLDQLVKGVIRAITGLIGGVAAFLPIPGLQGIVGFINSVIRMSLTYVDEIILGYNIRAESDTPFDTARQGVVLYAQNGATMVRNAVWLSVFMWLIAIVIFFFMLAPAAAVLYAMPGQLAGWSFVLAIVFAWALKAALLEPFAIAALMAVYFRTIETQTPNAEWDRKLSDASKHFRELKAKAAAQFRPAGSSGPAEEPRPA